MKQYGKRNIRCKKKVFLEFYNQDGLEEIIKNIDTIVTKFNKR